MPGEFAPGGSSGPVRWIAPEGNRWGVPLLDVRPFTGSAIATAADPRLADNALSYVRDDGRSFAVAEPPSRALVRGRLEFRVDRQLADGALFLPRAMEHKWAIYAHAGELLFVRSWRRELRVRAAYQVTDDRLIIHGLRGGFLEHDESPERTLRVADFLLRSHALGLVHPAPLTAGARGMPTHSLAVACFDQFGDQVHFASEEPVEASAPEAPLRTFSLLHMAVAGDHLDEARQLLDHGAPADLRDFAGLPPLHTAVAQAGARMVSLLVERGSPVDVRSDEGATALMQAAQARSLRAVEQLLALGAEADAADARGFSALHRAAEMGDLEIARRLVAAGACPQRTAHGTTPRSLAQQGGHRAVLALLDRHR